MWHIYMYIYEFFRGMKGRVKSFWGSREVCLIFDDVIRAIGENKYTQPKTLSVFLCNEASQLDVDIDVDKVVEKISKPVIE